MRTFGKNWVLYLVVAVGIAVLSAAIEASPRATSAANQFTSGSARGGENATADVRTFSVNITPAHSVPSNTYCVWTANVSGGTAPFSYAWYVNNSPVGGDSPNLGYTTGTSGFRIQVFVTDATSAQTNDSKIIGVGGSSC